MTKTSPLRTRRGARLAGAALSLACLLAAAPVAAYGAGPLPATVAATDDADPSPDAADLPAFAITPADRGIATNGSATVRLQFANASSDAIPSASATLEIGDALGSPEAVSRWLDGGSGGSFEQLRTSSAGEIAPGEVVAVSETVSVEGIPSGVYPLRGAWTGPTGPAEARSLLVVTDGDRPEVAIVVPVTGPVAEEGLYGADTLATLTGPDGLLTAQLDAVAGTDAILAVDPAIPAAIRALGADAPADAAAWLERLMGLPNDRFALQFADADVAAQIAGGFEAPLVPAELDAYLEGHTPAVEDDSTPAPADEATPEPTVDELLTVGASPATGLAWPAPGTADDELVAALADTQVLAPASTTADGEPALGDDVLAYADDVSDALLAAARATDPTVREHALVEATAGLWLEASASDEPLLLALDRLGSDELQTDDAGFANPTTTLDVTAEGLRDAVLSAVRSPAFSASTLSDVRDAAGGSVSLTGTGADAERVAVVRGYRGDFSALSHTAKALENPALLTSRTRAEFLRVLQVGWVSNPTGWQERAEQFASQRAARIDAFELQEPQPVQLLSPEAGMPIWIRNDLPYPARVVIEARPDDPRLSVEERTEVVLQPLATTRATIPVEARVGSGDVAVHLTMRAMTGQQLGPVHDMDVTVRADWERIGIGVLVALVAGLLIVGTIRQVRRRRRARDEAARAEDDRPSNEDSAEETA